MKELLIPIYLSVGFMGGTILLMQLIRWGLLVWVSTTRHGGDFLGQPKRRLIWSVPLVALHPAPYLFVGACFGMYRLLRDGPGIPAASILIGFVTYLAFAGWAGYVAFRRRKIKEPPRAPRLF